MASTSNPRGARLLNPHFLAASGILAVTAVLAGPVARHYGGQVKQAIPLRAPLDELDKSALGPYRFVQASTLEPDELNTLGTNQYIAWLLEDTSVADATSPLRFAMLQVTYFTGKPDMVPHRPDVCMIGAGYEIAGADNVDIQLPSVGASIPMRRVTFIGPRRYQQENPSVLYTFHANGDFTSSRDGVRLRTGSITDPRAYYSKIEVSFGSEISRPRNATPQQTLDGARKLLDRVVPLLLQRHFPDWQALQHGVIRPAASAASAGRSAYKSQSTETGRMHAA
jgi:hypothetical protein